MPEVQITYSKTSGKQRKKSPDPEWFEQITLVLEELACQNEIITIKKVSQKLGVCPENLRLHGVLPTIQKAKQSQLEKIRQQKSVTYKESADRYIEELKKAGIHATSNDIYEKLGTRRTVLVRSYPEITKYISAAIKNINNL